VFTDTELARALSGMPYPARRQQLVAWAELNCAPAALREALNHLPDETFDDRGQLKALFAGVEHRARQITGSDQSLRTGSSSHRTRPHRGKG
jgi:hypothetical protein